MCKHCSHNLRSSAVGFCVDIHGVEVLIQSSNMCLQAVCFHLHKYIIHLYLYIHIHIPVGNLIVDQSIIRNFCLTM